MKIILMHIIRISSLNILALALRELCELLVSSKTPDRLSGAVKSKEPTEPYNRGRYNTYTRDVKKAFSEFYTFCYKLVTPPFVSAMHLIQNLNLINYILYSSSRNIDMETATTLWTVILEPVYPIVSEFVEFANVCGEIIGLDYNNN
jgi:DCN1-like protein 4/5